MTLFQRVLEVAAVVAMMVAAAGPEPATAAESVQPRIAWYGKLAEGLAEAKRSGRPILLVSGAPQCLGVPGIW